MTDSTNLPADAAVTEATTDDMAGMTAADQAGRTGASDRIQLAQAVVQVPTPGAGETVTVAVAAGQTIQFDFDYVAAGNGEVLENGSLVLPVNGGQVVLEGFAAAATAQPPVELTNADGTVIELGDFLVAIDVPIDVLIDTAAGGGEPGGPLPDTTAANQGASFSPGNGPQILGNLDPNGPVDPTGLNYTVPERENTLFDLDEDDDGGDTPPEEPEDDTPDAEDDGPNTTNEGFCLDEADLDGGEGGQGGDVPSAIIVEGGEGGAPDGDQMAMLDADAGYPVDRIETFFGLPDGAIENLHPGETGTDGAAIKTEVTVEAGDQLTFVFNFLQAESGGEEIDFADYAVLVIGDQVFSLADNSTATLDGSMFSYDEQTGFVTFTYTFPAGGTYQIGFAVLNEGDNSVDPALLIDHVVVSGPGGDKFVDSFEGGLGNWDVLQGGLTTLSDNVLDNDSFGADGPGGITGISYVGGFGDADEPVVEPGKVTITAADGSWTLVFYTSDANADGRDMGEYIFTLKGPIDHPLQGLDDLHGAFQYTIVDADGDTDSATLSICIKDDVPTIDIYGVEGGATLDESVGADVTDPNAHDETSSEAGDKAIGFADLSADWWFNVDPGADGEASRAFSLTLASQGADSGLDDTASGADVLLFLENGVIVGKAGSANGAVVLEISIDADSGQVAINQFRAVKHDDPADDDEGSDPQSIDPNLVGVQLSVTDGDGDTTVSGIIDIGGHIAFEDDGPQLQVSGGEGAILLDETVDGGDDPNVPGGLLASQTTSLTSLLGLSADFGSDGPAAGGGFSFALAIGNPATGLTDTATGDPITLSQLPNGDIVGLTTGGDEVFRISINDATDEVTVTQSRAVEHPNTDSSNDTVSLPVGSISLNVTATDGDGDTSSAKSDLGSRITFRDDGPSAEIVLKPGAQIVLDESVGADPSDPNAGDEAASLDPNDIGYATILGSDLFTDNSSYGSDGPQGGGSAIAYEVGVPGPSMGDPSGLVDTATGHTVFLHEDGGVVYGIVGPDYATALADYTSLPGSVTSFTISVDAATGDVTVHQYRAVVHDNAGDPDEAGSPAGIVGGKVLLQQNVTDGDGDVSHAIIDLGSVIKFEDDGPSLEIGGAEGTITLDETENDGDDTAIDGLLANVTVAFASLYPSGSPAFGSDGMGATATTGVLTLSSPNADSGLVDTQSGEAVLLVQLDPFTIVGQTADGGDEVFRITLNGVTGNVTVTQTRAVEHDDPLDHDEAGSPETITAGLVGVTVTITDGDGDPVSGAVELGSLIKFEDDGPTLVATAASAGALTVDETNLNINASASFAGLFAPTYGSDGAGSVGGYTLGVNPGATGLVDTASGEAVTLQLVGGVVQGITVSGHLVFTVSVDSAGNVTFDQQRAVAHDQDGDTLLDHNDPKGLPAGLISLTAIVTDGDGDTATATADIGGAIIIRDDGPAAGTLKPGASIVLDESVGPSTPADPNAGDEAGTLEPGAIGFTQVAAGDLFTTPSFGADGPDAFSTQYSLSIPSVIGGVPTGLIDTATGQEIFLFSGSGHISGVVGNDDAGETVFRIDIDGSGNITVTQFRAIEHDNAGDPDESGSPEIMDPGKLLLTQTVFDKDGDFDSTQIDLGSIIRFEDDGPGVEVTPTGNKITVDESVGLDAADPNAADETTIGAPVGAIGFATIAWSALYAGTVSAGEDGLDATEYGLSIAGQGTPAGLTETASGNQIFLFNEGGKIVGREGLNALDAAGGDRVFEISINSLTGQVTVAQFGALEHGNPASHDEAVSIALNAITATITVTDGDGDTATDTADLGTLVEFQDDGPSLTTAGAETTTVDENDLPTGTDGTGPLTVYGDIGVDFGEDGPGDVTGITGPGGLFSNTVAIHYEPFNAATNTLVATAGPGGAPVFTVTINPVTGEYSFTLSGPIDHAEGSDNQAIEIDFTVTDGDGDTVDGSFTVDVTDDVSEAVDDEGTVSGEGSSINVTIMFDRSGSMDEDPGVDGFSTRIDLARAAIATLLHAYDSVGNVNILIVDFAGIAVDNPSQAQLDAVANNSGWLTGPNAIQEAIAYMAGLEAKDNTDYAAAVTELQNAYGPDTPDADESVVYFLSDGNPTKGGDPVSHELTDAQIEAWKGFLSDNHIDTAFAVGVGNGVTNLGALQDISHPSNDNARIVTDAALIDTLLVTVSGDISGNVLKNDEFGADGQDDPAITTLTYGSDTYVFNGTNITKNGDPYAPGLGTSILVIVAAFGTLTFDFATGKYDYAASAAGSDSFGYTIVDGDGDSDTGSLVINVGDSGVQEPHLVFGTDGNDVRNGTADAIPDIISTGDGDDSINALGSNDLLIGGAGSDALFGGGGDDVLIGGSQSGKAPPDQSQVLTPDGADYLDGGDGADALFGNQGNDILVVGSGDSADGGAGNDLFVLTDNVNFDSIDGGTSTNATGQNAGKENTTNSLNLQTATGDILTFNGSLDLTAIENVRVKGVETISMLDSTGDTSHSIAGNISHFAAGADTLTLNASDVISMSNGVFDPTGTFGGFGDLSNKVAIRVDGETGDTLNLTGGWTQVTGSHGAPAGYDIYAHASGGGNAEDAYVLVQQNVSVNAS